MQVIEKCASFPGESTCRIMQVSQVTSSPGGASNQIMGRSEWLRPNIWYAGLLSSRTQTKHSFPVSIQRPDLSKVRSDSKKYRNPIIYAQELHDEMVRDNLTRKQLAERHGVSSDRITQWMCLLKLPEQRLRKIESLGDYWDRQVITERELRQERKSLSD